MKNKTCFFLLLLCLDGIAKAAPTEGLLTDTVRIAAVGDIMLGSAYPDPKLLPPDDAKGSFEAVKRQLQSADIAFGNLEGVLLDEGETNKCKERKVCYAFRMPERYVNHLKYAGFDLLSVANNHSGDFEETGRLQTSRVLSKAGIGFAGFLSKPSTIIERNGIKYGFCAFAPNQGTLSLKDVKKAKETISMLKSMSDVVIVSVHGGAEGSSYQHITRQDEIFYGENRGNIYAFARLAIDAGADLILGHGPHVTRAVDLYKNRFIAYSLGNFCTNGTFNLQGLGGIAPLLEINLNTKGEFISAQVTSISQSKDRHLIVDPAHRALKVLRALTLADIPEAPLLISNSGAITPKAH